MAADAQLARIRGSAPSYSNQKLVIFQTDDYISGYRSVLSASEIREDGTFSAEVTLTTPRELILAVGGVEGILHAVPGNSYSIIFPKPHPNQPRTFDRTPADIGFQLAGPGEVNLLIRAFNSDYTRFLADHFYHFALEQFTGSETYRARLENQEDLTDLIAGKSASADTSAIVIISEQRFGELVAAFASRVHEKYGLWYTNKYFHDYVRYALAELELLSGASRRDLYTEYFMSQPAQPSHPSYMKFFNLFYSSQVIADPPAALRQDIARAINTERSGTRIAHLLKSDSLYQSPVLRSLAVMKGLRDAVGSGLYTRASIEASLDEMASRDTEPVIRAIAGRTVAQMRRGRAGTLLDDFVLLDDENDPWTWSEHTGRYTYILFFADWCSACKKDLMILEKQWEVYKQQIDFIAICMDDDYAAFRSYLESHRSQRFTFLFGGNDPLLRQKFGLRAIPHAVLTDPDGRLVADYTRRPGEGIQMEFDKIMKRASQNPGSGTWKDR